MRIATRFLAEAYAVADGELLIIQLVSDRALRVGLPLPVSPPDERGCVVVPIEKAEAVFTELEAAGVDFRMLG